MPITAVHDGLRQHNAGRGTYFTRTSCRSVHIHVYIYEVYMTIMTTAKSGFKDPITNRQLA